MGGGDGAWARKKMSHFGTTTTVVAAFIQFPLYGHPSWGIPRPFPYPFFFLFRSPRPLSALSLSPALFSLFRFCAPSPAFCFQASTFLLPSNHSSPAMCQMLSCHTPLPLALFLSLSHSALFFLFKSFSLPLLPFQSFKSLPFSSHQTTNRPAGCRKTSPGGISNHIGHDSNGAFRLSKWHYVWCPSHVCWYVRGRFLSGRCCCEAAPFR